MTLAVFSSTLGLGWIAGSTQRHGTGWFLALVNNEHLSPAAAPGDRGKLQVPEEQDSSLVVMMESV